MPKRYRLTDLEKKAWEFAKEAHRGVSRRFTGVPYFEHVRKVFQLVKKVDSRESLGAAALLHDCIEDCEWVTYDVILENFGKEVADLVKELTSVDELISGMGKPDYLLDKMATMSDDALIIKLCDRLQNISDHFTATQRFREKYFNETKYIIDRLKKNRQLNKKHLNVVSQIDGILENIDKRYIKRFDSFK